MYITKHLIISGQVQGVCYRAWMVGQAEHYGVHGWVRNRHDGTVEATLHGPEEKVKALIEQAYEGPEAARVMDIVASETHYDGPALFEQLPTE